LRLSPRQEASRLADALFPVAPCNHVVVRLVVEGALDEACCAGAFAAVVAANDACRFAVDSAIDRQTPRDIFAPCRTKTPPSLLKKSANCCVARDFA
jgi:hypothetical protein